MWRVRAGPKPVIEVSADTLNLAEWVRAGDAVFWGHGTSEPLTLSRKLMEQRRSLGRFRVFLGPTFSDTVSLVHADCVEFLSYCGIGRNQELHAAGVLDVLPCRISQIPSLIESGRLRCDVALLQLSREDASGRPTLGVSHDYLLEAAARARVVIAELNEEAPRTFGGDELRQLRIDVLVRTSRPVLELPSSTVSAVECAIASHVAGVIPDRAVLQLGIGAVPQALLSALRGHQDLGLHSGMVSDGVVDLIERGVITNAYKAIDRGVSVTGMLAGTPTLYDFADGCAAIHLRPVRYTHEAGVLARLRDFHAVNSAIEVDLSGQVNAEVIGRRYIGAVGGQIDFARAAQTSTGGRSIVALPSTTADGKYSRIVARLPEALVTTPRSDADLFVTEWGVADLRGQPLAERARRMLAIADPRFRDGLERAARAADALATPVRPPLLSRHPHQAKE
jgi:acyl-CoA hydrolase